MVRRMGPHDPARLSIVARAANQAWRAVRANIAPAGPKNTPGPAAALKRPLRRQRAYPTCAAAVRGLRRAGTQVIMPTRAPPPCCRGICDVANSPGLRLRVVFLADACARGNPGCAPAGRRSCADRPDARVHSADLGHAHPLVLRLHHHVLPAVGRARLARAGARGATTCRCSSARAASPPAIMRAGRSGVRRSAGRRPTDWPWRGSRPTATAPPCACAREISRRPRRALCVQAKRTRDVRAASGAVRRAERRR